ncbi:alpha/beta hydrolase [Sphingomonas oligophenolica]|uniref:Alpha/beta hydrolase n=2 Tax=Sphingomonas oligophenolica TaxID=301154 RepID=A0A502CHV1_9SPHN|nr:alpha/beta hydrolase [Sphingomonas oligophenolica]
MILLFHQAGSSMDEYATIAPKLAAMGYSALAIDQRSGGTMFGPNRTAAVLSRDPGYAAVQKDMQAAVDWASMQDVPIVLWGSSYSAALAFPVAAANPRRIKAMLAFSPGEYLDDKGAVARAAASLTMPVFVAVANGGAEAPAAKPIVAALTGDKTFYIPASGVHGSSTLIAARNPAGAAVNWRAVVGFLRRTVG